MPTRSCIVCRKQNDKDKLFRIVSDENDMAVLDKAQKISKRAIYICKSINCIEKAKINIQKGKLKTKIGINKDSLEVLLNEVENELGE